jgi:hypothetical protein
LVIGSIEGDGGPESFVPDGEPFAFGRRRRRGIRVEGRRMRSRRRRMRDEG